MSLSGALSNAFTGLTAASRGAQLVSSNLANALTEGYGRRDVELEAQHAGGGGVRVLSTVRHADALLIKEARHARTDAAHADVASSFAAQLEDWLGTPDKDDSLFADLKRFEAALVSASARPDQEVRLTQVVSVAEDLARRFNTASKNIQTARAEADHRIAKAVTALNDSLTKVQKLNADIASGNVAKRDVSGLMDQRQVLVDEIADWVPVRIMAREHDGIALYTPGGVALVDGGASSIAFSETHTLTAHTTRENGVLSGLEVNGHEIRDLSENGPLRGGRLSALFELRDETAPTVQAELDAFARDLTERFQTLTSDPTLGAGDAGLFVDGQARFDAADETGFASRISVNENVIVREGGAAWRLRDGLNAAAQGDVGHSALISSYSAALRASVPTASGASAGINQTAFGLLTRIMEDAGAFRLSAEQDATFARNRAAEAQTALETDGVNSDHEMQKLMTIEQAYAANAQMMRVAGEMMDELMRVV